MTSPREYNFTTDRIFANVSLDDIKKLFAARLSQWGIESLQESIDNEFKSRSGFSSFYDDFCTEWQDKPIENWDCNELSILFTKDFNEFYMYWDNIHEIMYEYVTITLSK